MVEVVRDNYVEKRTAHRMEIHCPLEFVSQSSDITQRGVVCNLSMYGVLLATDSRVNVGDELVLTLKPISTITPPMTARATVLRVGQADAFQDGKYLVACEIDVLN